MMYTISTKNLTTKTGKEDIDILKEELYKRYGESVFTREEFIRMYMDYTGCGRNWAEKDFRKFSRKNSKNQWIFEVD